MEYQKKVIAYNQKHLKDLQENKRFNETVLNDKDQKLRHNQINFYLPHEFGGAGEPQQQDLYGYFNVFKRNMDLAIIKPGWSTQQEFRVVLPQNSKVVEAEEMNLDEPGTTTLVRDSSYKDNDMQDEHGFDATNLQPITDKNEFCQKFKDNIYSTWVENIKPGLE